METALFTYGLLELPQIMRAVTGRVFPRSPAVLEGYRRRLLLDQAYPGIVEDAGEQTNGTLYRGLQPHAFELLDEFEGESYRRVSVVVRGQGGERLRAFAYVIPPSRQSLLSDRHWEASYFCREHLAALSELLADDRSSDCPERFR